MLHAVEELMLAGRVLMLQYRYDVLPWTPVFENVWYHALVRFPHFLPVANVLSHLRASFLCASCSALVHHGPTVPSLT